MLRAALVTAPLSLFAQAAPQVKLKPANAKLDEVERLRRHPWP